MYKIYSDGIILKIETGKLTSIPADPRNRDYREYLAWLEGGNTPEPADPEPVVKAEPTTAERLNALEQVLVTKGVIASRDLAVKEKDETIRR